MILNKITALSSACIPVSKPTAETECSAVSVRNLSASLFSFWYYLSCTCSPAFCWSVYLTLRSGRYDQFLVIWKIFPVPASGRFPGSTVWGIHLFSHSPRKRPPSQFSISGFLVFSLQSHSDEIAQVFHLFPYSPPCGDTSCFLFYFKYSFLTVR